ncbi:MAG: SEL1-like repeat protein [Alphaproteobacteria bacterium]
MRPLFAVVTLVATMTGQPVWAGFSDGWMAYQAGEYEAAMDAWLPLAKRGDLDAMYDMAALYETGRTVDGEPDMARAIAWYSRAAEHQLAAAQYRLAWLYDMGFGVGPDPEQSLDWYRQAAERGLAEAQFNLGVAYERGGAVVPDVVQAARWYREAADQNLPAAQFNLGRLYYHGAGVPKDMGLAAAWYERAAGSGYAPAQTNLGYMYENGIHLPQDAPTAAALYLRAAEQGFAAAQTNLGIMLSFGLGVPRDYTGATRWYLAAARQGDIDAQTNIALMYANGLGVERDQVEAYAWLTLATAGAGQAGETAAKYRERLVERFGDDDVAAGDSRMVALRGELTAAGIVENRVEPRETAGFGQLDLTIQRRLAALGYYLAIVDGITGPETRAAIRAYQFSVGSPQDGLVSTALLARLDDTLRDEPAANPPVTETRQ